MRLFSIILCLLVTSASYGQLFGPKKPAWGASSLDVEKAQCRSQLPDTKGMKSILMRDNYWPRKRFSHQIWGLTLKDESTQLISDFTSLTLTKGGFDSECESITCLMTQLFGESSGINMLYIYNKYKLSLSPIARGNIRANFSSRDMRVMKNTLASLPPELLQEGESFQIQSGATKGDNRLAGNEYIVVDPGNRTMMIFPRWSNIRDSSRKEYLFFHELAHIIDIKLKNISRTQEWLDFSGWYMKDHRRWGAKNKKTFVSSYVDAAISEIPDVAPQEDFAEAVSAYRYNPAHLKKVSMAKYNFIKDKVFNGKTFEKEEDCVKLPLADIEISESTQRVHENLCTWSMYGLYDREADLIKACLEYKEINQ